MDGPEKRSIETRAGYELWAKTYDQTENELVALDQRVLAGFMGPMVGAHVLDAGCGTGRHTVALARAADRVTAMDFAPAMLEQTRSKLAAEGLDERVTLLAHDLHDMPYPLAESSVHGVVCALVGEHIDDLPGLFAEFSRVLIAGGWLVFSVFHPFLALRGMEANFTEAAGDVEYRLGAADHLVSDYVNALRGAGLHLDMLVEPRVDAALVAEVPKAERYLGQPLLLVMRAVAH